MSGRERVEALAKVLEVHDGIQQSTKRGRREGLTEWFAHCTCGEPMPWATGDRADAFRTHLAEMLTDSPAMRDLLAEAKADAWDEGARCAGSYGHEDDWTWPNLTPMTVNPYRETTTGGRDE